MVLPSAGHARVYCSFDVLFRLLQHLGYQVQYVRNFTDIDDKIIARAAEVGEDPLQLSQRCAMLVPLEHAACATSPLHLLQTLYC